MSTDRKLWLDTRGVPVITTSPNGERNARRWGWTPAVAVPKTLTDALRGREPGDEYVDWKAMYEQAIQERDALDSRLTRVDMECAEALDRAAEFERERDRWKEATKRALEHRDEANARADAAEAKVRELREQVQRSGSIVYTVEEQDIEAEGRRVEVVDTGRQFNIRIQGQPVNAIKSSTEAREEAQRHIEAAARCEAIARRIETDTAVDPVEALAEELYTVVGEGRFSVPSWDNLTDHARENYRRMAKHVIERKDEDQ